MVRKGSSALSGLAIVLGVAFVSGTMIFTDTLSKTFNDLFESTAADVNVTRPVCVSSTTTDAASRPRTATELVAYFHPRNCTSTSRGYAATWGSP